VDNNISILWEENDSTELRTKLENNLTIDLNDITNDTKKSVIENPCEDIGDAKKLKKKCPKCGREQTYSRKDVLQLSIKNNSICLSCSQRGKVFSEETRNKIRKSLIGNHHTEESKNKISIAFKGKKKSKEHVEKVKNALKGRIPTIEERIKNSLSNKGRVSTMKGKHHTEETKYKLRVAKIEDLKKKNILLGKDGARNFNTRACEYIDKLNKEKGWNLQHALNGGEVELYGYFVDGYDKEKNIVFEYDEKKHNETYWKNKDIIRQNNLIKNIDPSLFLRYDEQWDRLYEVKSYEN
jgi:ribosomal protein S14